MSAQLPEDQLSDLMLHLHNLPADQARTILNSQPQIAYALIALMTKMNAINVDVTQNGVAATQPPPAVQPVPALPLHMAPQPSRGGTPQYATPPPPSYPLAHPSKYHPYTNGAVMPPQQTSQYSAQPPQAYAATQSAASVIPDALAAMPEEQRAMIMRFISMTPDQINQLPPAERASIMQLRATLGVP